MEVTIFEPSAFTLSVAAVGKVKTLMQQEDNENLKLRVFVTGGGCSGFEYGFTFDEDVAENDSQINTDGAVLLIDSLSYQYLVGSVIDYREDLQGSRFIVTNPNAASTCGCGSSFSI